MSALLIDSLVAAAHEAGAVIQGVRKKGLVTSKKALSEIVTSADYASRDVLVSRLSKDVPGVPLVSEEGEHRTLSAGPVLVVDELDGTAPFAAGSKHWGILLALVEHEPTHGVIYLPDLGITISAEKGRGCTLNGSAVSLKADEPLDDLLLGTEINRSMAPDDWHLVQAATARFRAVRCTASAAASACELLTGLTHAYLNVRGGKIWDFAAVSLAVTEANGTATDPRGQALKWSEIQMGFMATAGPAVMRQML